MGTHSSILAWKILWTEEPGRLYSIGSQRIGPDWAHTHTYTSCVSLRCTVAAAKSLQSCPTLCDPIDGSPPGSPVPGILHARTLEWVAISFSNAWKWKVKVKSPSVSDSWQPHGLQPTGLLHPWDFPDKSTGVGCHCLLPWHVESSPNQEMEGTSLHWQANSKSLDPWGSSIT